MFLKNVSLAEAKKLAEENKDNVDFVIIDVRTPAEADKCKFKNSVNIDLFSKDFTKKLDELDKNKIYLVHCRGGNRSLKALKIMQKMGFKKIYHSIYGIDCL